MPNCLFPLLFTVKLKLFKYNITKENLHILRALCILDKEIGDNVFLLQDNQKQMS